MCMIEIQYVMLTDGAAILSNIVELLQIHTIILRLHCLIDTYTQHITHAAPTHSRAMHEPLLSFAHRLVSAVCWCNEYLLLFSQTHKNSGFLFCRILSLQLAHISHIHVGIQLIQSLFVFLYVLRDTKVSSKIQKRLLS